MSAAGRWLCVVSGLADGVGETAAGLPGVGFVVTGAGAWAALPVAGIAVPVTGAGACDVAAATGAAALAAGFAVGLAGAVGCFDLGTVGVVVLDTVGGAAARVGEATGLVVAGLDGVTVAVGGDWLSGGAAD